MSVCDPVNGMHKMFEKVLPKHLFAAAPECRDDADWQDSYIEDFKQLVEKHHHELAAVIVEPLVQGAGGMRVYCAEYLRQIRALCDEFNILLIFDEIATGFGRTGSMFAYEQAGIVPDIICMGKALTGGYMTLAAVMCNQQVADGIAADGSGVLMHGPTFMANPLACRVAAASIDLLLESDWQTQVSTIEKRLNTELTKYRDHELVKDVRVKGAIGVVELNEPLDEAMDWLPGFIIDQGVWIRPFRTMIYIMPPYIIDESDLHLLCDAIGNILNKLSSN